MTLLYIIQIATAFLAGIIYFETRLKIVKKEIDTQTIRKNLFCATVLSIISIVLFIILW